jgi:D-tagatose-1,6-bisphosphate aldolase subunit GatZ/KbaZ
VRSAIERLLANLTTQIPRALLSQYLPRQYARVREGLLRADPGALVRDRIGDCIDDYLYATRAAAPSAGSAP